MRPTHVSADDLQLLEDAAERNVNTRPDCCDDCTDHGHTEEESYGPNGEELCCKCGQDIDRKRPTKKVRCVHCSKLVVDLKKHEARRHPGMDGIDRLRIQAFRQEAKADSKAEVAAYRRGVEQGKKEASQSEAGRDD